MVLSQLFRSSQQDAKRKQRVETRKKSIEVTKSVNEREHRATNGQNG